MPVPEPGHRLVCSFHRVRHENAAKLKSSDDHFEANAPATRYTFGSSLAFVPFPFWLNFTYQFAAAAEKAIMSRLFAKFTIPKSCIFFESGMVCSSLVLVLESILNIFKHLKILV